MDRFTDKVAIIAGGASGIGEWAAYRIASEGGSIVIADTNTARAEATCDTIRSQHGASALFVEANLTDEAACQAVVSRTLDTFGRLDVLVNSTGVSPGGGTVIDTSLEHWDKLIDIDLKAIFLMCKYAIPPMIEAGQGSIVNISSIGGMGGAPHGMAFQTAKGGLVNLTKHMAIAHAQQGVRVNCICPGVIYTPLVERWLSNEDAHERARALHPMNRVGKPEETAAAIAFLASDDASFITGAILPVDGGHLARAGA